MEEKEREQNAKEELFSVQESNYGERYKEDLMAQYKMYIDATDKISDRREKANVFFLTANSALLVAYGVLYDSVNSLIFLLILIPLLGIIISYWWYRIIVEYKKLNTGKFNIVHMIEDKLPAKPYKAEWIMLGEGKVKKLYNPLTNIEKNVPKIFIGSYIIIILATLLS